MKKRKHIIEGMTKLIVQKIVDKEVMRMATLLCHNLLSASTAQT